MKKIIITFLSMALAISVAGCGKKVETADDYADKLVNGEITPDVETENDESGAPKAKVNLAISDEDMGKLVDAAGDEYKSFAIQPIESADFFIGKQFRVVATIQDHKMTNVYTSDIEGKYTNDSLVIKYKENGKPVEQNYLVYTVADEVKESPEGRQFSYVAYGDKEITSKKTDGTIGVVMSIEMRDDVDMGEAAANSYIMLMEASNEGVYEILKVIE